MCSLRCLGACSVMDIFSNKNVAIIVLRRILTELPGILEFIEAIFRILFDVLEEHFLSTYTRVQVIPQPLEMLFQYETFKVHFSFSINLSDF